jgi:hypothetical protein
MKLIKNIILAPLALLFAVFLVATPGVQANTGAGATILNNVTVTYYDAGGVQTYSANASTFTTVNLVKAGLTYSGRPTSGSKGTTAAMPADQTIDSGSTASYLIALTANANGNDLYSLSRTIGSVTNMNTDTVTYTTVKADGSTTVLTGTPGPANVNIGASVIQAVGAGFIKIPGGSLATAGLSGVVVGDGRVLVINGVDYLINSVVAGNAPSNGHTGNTYYNTAVSGTAEVLDTINLVANSSGANVAFTGTGVNVGDLAKEQVLVKVTVTGTVGSTAGTNGVVPFSLTTTDSSSAHSVISSTVTTTFRASNLQVEKNVRNCGASGSSCGSWAASTTGNPGDILEYQVLVNNAGLSSAAKVSAADAVPVYTTLMCYTGSYLGTAATCAAATYFATITTGANTSQITYGSANDECATAPLNVGAGSAAGSAEGSAMNFYMGSTCNGITPVGGTVAAAATYTILYRVKMN